MENLDEEFQQLVEKSKSYPNPEKYYEELLSSQAKILTKIKNIKASPAFGTDGRNNNLCILQIDYLDKRLLNLLKSELKPKSNLLFVIFFSEKFSNFADMDLIYPNVNCIFMQSSFEDVVQVAISRYELLQRFDHLIVILSQCNSMNYDTGFKYLLHLILDKKSFRITVVDPTSKPKDFCSDLRLYKNFILHKPNLENLQLVKNSAIYTLESYFETLTEIEERIKQEIIQLSQKPSPTAAGTNNSKQIIFSNSTDWLKKNGYDEKKHSIYSKLERFSFKECSSKVPVLKTNVSAKVHQNCMNQLQWKDGSMRYINYEQKDVLKCLEESKDFITLLSNRITWIEEPLPNKNSHIFFGRITEKNLIIYMSRDLRMHQSKIHQLFQEQISQLMINQVILRISDRSDFIRLDNPNMDRNPQLKEYLEARPESFRKLSILRSLTDMLEDCVKRQRKQSYGIYIVTLGDELIDALQIESLFDYCDIHRKLGDLDLIRVTLIIFTEDSSLIKEKLFVNLKDHFKDLIRIHVFHPRDNKILYSDDKILVERNLNMVYDNIVDCRKFLKTEN